MELSSLYICQTLAYKLGIVSRPGFSFFTRAVELSLKAPALLQDMGRLFGLLEKTFPIKSGAIMRHTKAAVKKAWNQNPAIFFDIVGEESNQCPTLQKILIGCCKKIQRGESSCTHNQTARLASIWAASEYFMDQIGFSMNSHAILRMAIQNCLTDSICTSSLAKYIYTPTAQTLHLSSGRVGLIITNALNSSYSYAGKEFINRVLAVLPDWESRALTSLSFFRGLFYYAYKNGYIADFTRTKLCRWGIFLNRGFTFLAAAVDLQSQSPAAAPQTIIHEVAKKYGVKESSVNNRMEETLQQCWLRGIGEFAPFLPEKLPQPDLSFELFFYLWQRLQENEKNENMTAKGEMTDDVQKTRGWG